MHREYRAVGAPQRVRALMSAWSGDPLTPQQIACLIQVEADAALHKALSRAVRDGTARRVSHGRYAPATPSVPRSPKGGE